MEERPLLSIQDHFADLPGPRIERTKRHHLLDIITIAVCAVISVADSWLAVEHYGLARRDWLVTFLELPNGIPSHDTFGRMFARLDPEAFEACVLRWVQSLAPDLVGQVVAIDGKVMRRSQDCAAGRPALELVSAWVTDQQLVLGRLAVAPHSNKIPAVPALLALLALRGAVVIFGAMHCQSSTARAIRSGAASYVPALKGNQPTTHDAVETFFAEGQREEWRGIVHQSLQTEDAGHGRVEQRRYWTTTDPALLGYLNPAGQVWPDLGCAGMVERCRTSEHGTSRETSYYLSTLPGQTRTLPRRCVGTGGLRIASIGCWMWPFAQTRAGDVQDMAPRTWRCSGASPSI